MRYPLVSGGNFGSRGHDKAAAMRSPSARWRRWLEMVRDITENAVDFKPNYDGKEEPVVLPSASRTCWSTVPPASRSAWQPYPDHNLREVASGGVLEEQGSAEEFSWRRRSSAFMVPTSRWGADRRPPWHRGPAGPAAAR